MNTTDPKQSDYAGPCPRCGGPVPNEAYQGQYSGALSRYDSETYICSSCGTEEAFCGGHMIPFDIPLSPGTVVVGGVVYTGEEGVTS